MRATKEYLQTTCVLLAVARKGRHRALQCPDSTGCSREQKHPSTTAKQFLQRKRLRPLQSKGSSVSVSFSSSIPNRSRSQANVGDMQFIRGHSRYTLDAATARPLWRTVPFFFFFFFFGRGERGLGGATVRIVLDGRVRVAVCIDFVQGVSNNQPSNSMFIYIYIYIYILTLLAFLHFHFPHIYNIFSVLLLIYSSSAPNNNSYGFGGAGADDGEGMDGFGHDDGEPDLNDLYEVDADGDPHTSIQNDTHGEWYVAHR